MQTITFSCAIHNTSEFDDLQVELWIDEYKFFDQTIPTGTLTPTYEFEENEEDHILKIVLKNKTQEHTSIDDNGNILNDACISFDNFCFDDINIDQILYERAVYRHDKNSTDIMQAHKFFGTAGCNGEIEFKFKTPFYIWLLENM